MRFDRPLVAGRLLGREKRFLAHVQLDGGALVTAHCPNSGSMRGCLGVDWPVLLSPATSLRRKLQWTLEMIRGPHGWIGVHTHRANRLAEEAIVGGAIPELGGYDRVRREVPYGKASRVDLVLEGPSRRPCYVEVKNVTMVDEHGRFAFPDSVTARGLKHLRELESVAANGDRAAMLFVIQRSDGRGLAPADFIDPAFGAGLRRAARRGVEILAYRADVTPDEILLVERQPVILDRVPKNRH